MTYHFHDFVMKDGEPENPADVVNKALDELRSSIDGRFNDLHFDKLTARLDAIETKLQRPGNGGGKQDNDDDRKAIEHKAFVDYLHRGETAGEAVFKTLIASSDPQGGYLVPEDIAADFIRALVQFSPIRRLATVRTTTSTSQIYPTATAATGVQWVGETTTRTASTMSFGQAEVVVKEQATFIDISNRLLADGPAALAEVRTAFATMFGQHETLGFLKGNGGIEPNGLLTDAALVTMPSGQASTLGTGTAVSDLLTDVYYSLPDVYRSAGTWAMNSKTAATIRKVKDSTGQYIWTPGITAGEPATILGRPVVEFPDLEDVAAGKLPILFGDFSGYRILDRLDMESLVDVYTQRHLGLTRIHFNRRTGGRLVEPFKLVAVRVAAA